MHAGILASIAGNVLYVEGSAFLPEYWIELSLEAHSSYKCISFFHATHQELYWILVLTQSDFYNVKYLLTLTPIGKFNRLLYTGVIYSKLFRKGITV